MKIYKHIFRSHEPQMDHVVYALAEEPVVAAILAQAYALRRGLAWKRFKQTVAAHRPHINVEPFAWNDVSFSEGYRPTLHDRLDYETRRDIVMGYRETQVPKSGKPVAAYREDEEGTVAFCTPTGTAACEELRGKPYTLAEAARMAYENARGYQKDLHWNFLCAIGEACRKATSLSVGQYKEGLAKISFTSRDYLLCQKELEDWARLYGYPVNKISVSSYSIPWNVLIMYMGARAQHEFNTIRKSLGL